MPSSVKPKMKIKKVRSIHNTTEDRRVPMADLEVSASDAQRGAPLRLVLYVFRTRTSA